MKNKIILSIILSLSIITAGAVPIGYIGKINPDDDYLATYRGVVMQVITTYINGIPHQVLSQREVTAATLSTCQYYSNLYASHGGYVIQPCYKMN